MAQIVEKGKFTAFNLAFSGICLALCVVLLLFSSFSIGIDKLLALVAGFFVFLIAEALGVKWGILFYVAATLLSLLIVPAKIELMVFIIGFGPFAIIHSLLYKIKKMHNAVRFIISTVVIVVLFFIVALLFKEVFTVNTVISIGGKVLENSYYAFALGFGVFSGIICCLVYNSLSKIFLSRIRSEKKTKKEEKNMPSIVLPKLYNNNEEVMKEEKDDDSTID